MAQKKQMKVVQWPDLNSFEMMPHDLNMQLMLENPPMWPNHYSSAVKTGPEFPNSDVKRSLSVITNV